MESRQKIYFHGESLLLAGLRSRLRQMPGFEICSFKKEEIDATGPCMVIYDTDASGTDDLLATMQDLPSLLLIGINPETHAVLLSGQAAGSISLDQITQIFQIKT